MSRELLIERMTTSSAIDVRRAGDRFATRLPWLESHHSFSFSRHYDPTNTSFGVLLWGGRLRPDQTVAVPDARFAHVFVARGGLTLDGAGRLEAGDAARLTEAGDPSITADPAQGAEVLIWELAA